MSRHSEIMLRGFAAFSRGDWDACLAEVHPEIEWHVAFKMPDLPPDKSVYHGHEEVRQLFDAFSSAWDELSVDVEEILHDERDTLVSRVRFRGSVSGIEVDRRLFYAQQLRDGLLVRQMPADTEEEAFAAAGVERD